MWTTQQVSKPQPHRNTKGSQHWLSFCLKYWKKFCYRTVGHEDTVRQRPRQLNFMKASQCITRKWADTCRLHPLSVGTSKCPSCSCVLAIYRGHVGQSSIQILQSCNVLNFNFHRMPEDCMLFALASAMSKQTVSQTMKISSFYSVSRHCRI